MQHMSPTDTTSNGKEPTLRLKAIIQLEMVQHCHITSVNQVVHHRWTDTSAAAVHITTPDPYLTSKKYRSCLLFLA